MVLLSSFLGILAAGLAFWIFGELFGYPEVAVIAGVLILGAGAAVALGDLQVQDGEIHHELEEPGTGDNVTTEIEPVYRSVEFHERLPLGGVVMILGGLGIMRTLDSMGQQ